MRNTKGQWVVSSYTEQTYCESPTVVVQTSKLPGRRICTLSMPGDFTNAALLAAAPDLLAALEWAMGQIAEPVHEWSQYADQYAFARSALTKATRD